MKKIFVSILAVSIAVSAFAQSKEDQSYNRASGENSIEVLFTPFQSDGTMFKLTDFGIRYRYYFGANAIRLGVGLGFDTEKEGEKKVATAADYDNLTEKFVGTKDYYEKTNKNSFKVALGYERHFDINRRLDLYVGGEFGYQGTFERTKVWKNNDYYTKYVSGSKTEKTTHIETADYVENNPTENVLSLAALTGFDFYIYKGIYLGAEVGFKYKHTSYSGATSLKEGNEYTSTETDSYTTWTKKEYEGNKTSKTEYNSSTKKSVTTTEIDPETTSYNGGSNLSFYVEPALRIGWRF